MGIGTYPQNGAGGVDMWITGCGQGVHNLWKCGYVCSSAYALVGTIQVAYRPTCIWSSPNDCDVVQVHYQSMEAWQHGATGDNGLLRPGMYL